MDAGSEKTPEQLEAERAEREARSKECLAEVQKVLEKYNCRTDVSITVKTNGAITGSVEINAR